MLLYQVLHAKATWDKEVLQCSFDLLQHERLKNKKVKKNEILLEIFEKVLICLPVHYSTSLCI